MHPEKISRINELARKKKQDGLTEEELAEHHSLRQEYLSEFRENLRGILDHVTVQEPDGTRHPLRKKDPPLKS